MTEIIPKLHIILANWFAALGFLSCYDTKENGWEWKLEMLVKAK